MKEDQRQLIYTLARNTTSPAPEKRAIHQPLLVGRAEVKRQERGSTREDQCDTSLINGFRMDLRTALLSIPHFNRRRSWALRPVIPGRSHTICHVRREAAPPASTQRHMEEGGVGGDQGKVQGSGGGGRYTHGPPAG
ncbi:unnamed protein product [Arctogadus glacialis]